MELTAPPRFEVFPSSDVARRTAVLPPGTKVAITCSPRRGIHATLWAAEELRGQGLDVVPHLSARLITGESELAAIVKRLTELDVDDMFVVGGDVSHPGPFASALSLLEAVEALGYRFRDVGVAAYPDGHPFLGDAVLLDALLAKQPLATYMVTQLCFDPDQVRRWIGDVRRKGVRLPVYVGVPGVVERARLLRIARRIGVVDSARFAGKHTGMIARLLSRGGFRPDPFVAALEPAAERIAGLHLYTFNEVASTHRWQRNRPSL